MATNNLRRPRVNQSNITSELGRLDDWRHIDSGSTSCLSFCWLAGHSVDYVIMIHNDYICWICRYCYLNYSNYRFIHNGKHQPHIQQCQAAS